jgi:16S rRNA pseudouridine516 synthase
LLTDDGAIVHALTSPKKDIGKWYRVRTDKAIPRDAVEVFASGELTLDGETKPCRPAVCVLMDDDTQARLRLTEGKFHQVKRMFAFFGCTVTELHRESFGSLSLESAGVLEPGDFTTLPLDFDFSGE